MKCAFQINQPIIDTVQTLLFLQYPLDVLFCNATSQTCWVQQRDEKMQMVSRVFVAQLHQIVHLKTVVVDESGPVKNEHLSLGPVCLLSDMGGPPNFLLTGCLRVFFFRRHCVKSCGHPDSMKSADQREQSQLVILLTNKADYQTARPHGE